MLRLGHIDYSNCVPVHAALLEHGAPGIRVRHGVPSELNELLANGRIDVAPSSSIEYARHAPRYRLLPGLSIASRGPVRSIFLEAARAPGDLDDVEVALPTASATSVVLLKVLLDRRHRVRPRYRWFRQGPDADPLEAGAEAALWIGDAALARRRAVRGEIIDLGAAWLEWTGLPFVYALWQTCVGSDRDAELAALHDTLRGSRSFFDANIDALAARYGPRFELAPAELEDYWRSLEYGLGPELQDGLRRFYAYAHEIGEAPDVSALRFVPV